MRTHLALLLTFFASVQLAHSSSLPIPISFGNHTQVTSQCEKRWDNDGWNCRDLWDRWCRSNCWDYSHSHYRGGGAGLNGRYPRQGIKGYLPNGDVGRSGNDAAWPGHDHECYRRCYSHCDDDQDECAAPPPLSVLFAFLLLCFWSLFSWCDALIIHNRPLFRPSQLTFLFWTGIVIGGVYFVKSVPSRK